MISSDTPYRMKLTVTGIVQGVGFRPYVYRLARECGLTGSVLNNGQGVEIDVQGTRVREFVERLPREAPPLVLITGMREEALPPGDATDFVIVKSAESAVTSAMIPADVATCGDCLTDIRDPENRRYRYPFTNCTNCGPRYTITSSIPYDRPSTSMRDFAMCEDCTREYQDPENRRFHAQPNACPVCGPQLLFRRNARLHGCDVDIEGDPALRAAITELVEGRILALRGLGGYHLAVDARNEKAVHLLRVRKHRYEKPLAVMVPDLAAAQRLCHISPEEAALLTSAQRPIVILRQRKENGIAQTVSLDNPTLGVMLPYTPLHHLLMEGECDALVMTSGNISEEPICTSVEDAEHRLGDIADAFLHHNRDILQRCDDSVFRVIAGEARPVRRARGYVPRPVLLADEGPSVIATGAELKNTCCVTSGRAAFLSQHIGDLENFETLGFFEDTLTHLLHIFEVTPAAIAYDLHPDYLGTQWAKGHLDSPLQQRFAALPRIPVQHHHAHLVSCLAENGTDEPAIGVILDGTGYGTDGTIWGGEFLTGNSHGFTRAGHFATVAMPGADKAVKEPWRMAYAYLHAAFGENAERAFPEWTARRRDIELSAARFALEGDVNAPRTSSCGRLFDAVASLAGLYDTVHFEAQAAIALEFAAMEYLSAMGDPATGAKSSEQDAGEVGGIRDVDGIGDVSCIVAAMDAIEPYSWSLDRNTEKKIVLSFFPAIREIAYDVRNGESPGHVAARFHRTLIVACAEVVESIASDSGLRTVALSGGSFQNALLLEGLHRMLADRNFTVLTHRQLPSNDGGVALGQAVIARTQLEG
ncbi:MAG: carbamoyltransferase HypF [Bacteroidetes bacterium]|nr:carbamoyltransferase HypF [Bacteroidota bacterium]